MRDPRAGRLVAAVLLLVSVLGGGSVISPATASARESTRTAQITVAEATARIELTTIGPTLVDPTTTVTVTGTIANTGTAPLELVTARLRLVRSRVVHDLLACVFEVVEHKPDSMGIALTPILYEVSAEIARAERWDTTAEAFRLLRR